MNDAAAVLRAARARAGITQRELAVRAGTRQATISRLESGAEAPTLARLERLLAVMGFRLRLEVERLGHDLDPGALRAARSLTPAERLSEAISWNLLATQLETAARRERR